MEQEEVQTHYQNPGGISLPTQSRMSRVSLYVLPSPPLKGLLGVGGRPGL